MTCTIQSIVITLFFLVMMGLLLRDHVIPSLTRGEGVEVDRRVLADSWANQDDWMVIRLGNEEIGALRTTAEEDSRSSARRVYTVTSNLELRTRLIRGRVLSAARLNGNLELQALRVRAHFPGLGAKPLAAKDLDAQELPRGAFELSGLVDGLNARFSLRKDDAVQFFQQHLARSVTMVDSITPVLRAQMLNKGVDYTIDVYDPLYGNNSGKMLLTYVDDVVESIDGTPQSVRKVELRFASSRMTLLVDSVGNVLRREIPLLAPTQAGQSAGGSVPVLVLERLDRAVARAKYPELVYTPETPQVTARDVQGENRGDVIKGINIFSLIGSGLSSGK